MAVGALSWRFHGTSQCFSVQKRVLVADVRPEIRLSMAAEIRSRKRLAARSRCRLRRSMCFDRFGRVVARLFGPEDFDPAKLTVSFENGSSVLEDLQVSQLLPRTYTLTHSDVTGHLQLSIGPRYNQEQLNYWYTRLMRDEIVAEWRCMNGRFSLHVYCHVSGGHPLLAPPALRNKIFQREMPLVLEAIRYGDGVFLARHPVLDRSTVWVHFQSDNQEYHRADCWGPLFYSATSNGLKYAPPQPSILPLPKNGGLIT